MSKAIKALLRNELKKRLAGSESLAVVSLVGMNGQMTNRLRRELRAHKIQVTVVKNSIARQALKESGLEQAGELLNGPCALAIGGESVVSVVRELLSKHKDMPKLTVLGAFMEGEVFPAARVEELSKFPTRDEAIAGMVALVLSPARKIASAVGAPAAKLAGVLKAIQENLEKAAPAVVEAAVVEAPAAAAPPPAAG